MACSISLALDARVLIDESSDSRILRGQFRIQCKKSFKHKNNLCSRRQNIFNLADWQFTLKRNRLFIKNFKTKKIKKLRGRYFSLQGKLSLRGKELSRIDIVNLGDKNHWVAHLPVNQYLQGVMTAEVPESWPLQALKAQAIASRSYFIFKKRQSKKHYDVRSDIMDQVFSLEKKASKKIIQAVAETKGQVLYYPKKKEIFPAYFHSDCGGGTSREGDVWRQPTSGNQGVKDPHCEQASTNEWAYQVDRDHLMAKLHSIFFLPSGVELRGILPRKMEGQRAFVVDLLFSKNIFKRMNADAFRKLLGFGKLKSTQFQVKAFWNHILFTGRGFGHGVGMCQWGAKRWADQGLNFREILKHYYPNSMLRKLGGLKARHIQANIGTQ